MTLAAFSITTVELTRQLGRPQFATSISRSVLLRQLSTHPSVPAAEAEWMAPVQKPPPEQAFSSSKKKQRTRHHVAGSLSVNVGTVHSGEQWTRPHRMGGRELTPAEQWAEFNRVREDTNFLGTRVKRQYVPASLISDPPAPEDVTLELLMASQTHMGHNTSLWNPANARYIYGARQGIHIISLEVTAAHLRRAARVVEEVAYAGGLILFVGDRRGQMEIVTSAAERAGACHLFTKWMPGSITNRDLIIRSKSIKVVDGRDRELRGFDLFNSSARPLVPDLVVCLNPVENYTLLYECALSCVPTIGVIDTDANPSWVTYTIPANDDSLRAAAVIGGVLGRAGERGRQRRLRAAESGNVTWKTPPALTRHIGKEITAAVARRKEIMRQIKSRMMEFNEEELKILESKPGSEARTVSDAEMMNLMAEAAASRVHDADNNGGGTVSGGDFAEIAMEKPVRQRPWRMDDPAVVESVLRVAGEEVMSGDDEVVGGKVVDDKVESSPRVEDILAKESVEDAAVEESVEVASVEDSAKEVLAEASVEDASTKDSVDTWAEIPDSPPDETKDK